MKKGIKILVSHPGRQHTHHLCIGLQEKNRLEKFITSIWYKPKSRVYRILQFFPSTFYSKLINALKKKYLRELNSELVLQFPYYELLRQLASTLFRVSGERWTFLVERKHDKFVSKYIRTTDASAVIGYEKACLYTFKEAKKLGKITILDLAQVHYSHIRQLRDDYSIFKSIMSDKLFDRINKVKENEIALSDYIICLSSYAKQTLKDAGIPNHKIFVANLGVNLDSFIPKKVYNSGKSFRLLFVGSVIKRKGIHILLEAVKQLNLPNTKLEIVGNIAESNKILKEYEGLYVHYPYMHHEKLCKKYAQSDVYILPSFLDSWAQTVVEAMACGTPVIVSEHTGAKDIVQDGGGFIIPVNDIEALKDKIRLLYDNRNLVEQLGKQAAELANQYSWKSYTESINKFLEGIHPDNKESMILN